jgi:Leucine-rich repeat (LRR) protein
MNLTNLNISNNRITNIPAEIGNLRQLDTLDLSYNQITELPVEMINLSLLSELWIECNELSEVPEVIVLLPSLNKLCVVNNPLSCKSLANSEIGLDSTYVRMRSFIKNYFVIALGCSLPVVNSLLVHTFFYTNKIECT